MARKKKKNEFDKFEAELESTKLEVYGNLVKKQSSGERLSREETALLKKLDGELYGGDQIKTLTAAAKYLGVAAKTISIHVTKGNINRNPDGSFERDELDRWAIETGKRKNAGEMKTLTAEKDLWEIRFRKARALKEQTLADQLRGRLISLKDLEKAWGSRVAELTSGLETLVARLPPQLVGKTRIQIQKILKEEIYQLRASYAKTGKYTPKVKYANSKTAKK